MDRSAPIPRRFSFYSHPLLLLPQQVLRSSSHKGGLVWLFLTGQIEVSLLPLLTEGGSEGGVEGG